VTRALGWGAAVLAVVAVLLVEVKTGRVLAWSQVALYAVVRVAPPRASSSTTFPCAS
jgi:hypothetical protein